MAPRLLGVCLLLVAGCSGGGGGGPAGPPRVVFVAPAPDTTTGTPPTAIEVRFNQAMAAATINDQTFLLTWSGGDGSFAEGNEVTIQALTLTMPAADRAVFDLSGLPPLPEEIYRLRLVGTGADPIQSAFGEALDGEFAGTLPSGNGVEGGDFISFFQTSTAVTDLLPAPGSVLAAPPATVVVRLSTDVDPATVTGATFRVLRSGGDTTFHDGDEVGLVAGSITETGPGEFTFDLTGNALPPDTYQVTLVGGDAGRALRCDGIDDFVRVAARPEFAPGTGSWTVECWVLVDDPARANGLLECADGDFVNGWRLGQGPTPPFHFSVDGAGGTRQALGGPGPTAATWHHVAGVYDSALGTTRLYVDGVLEATDASGAAGAATPTADLVFATYAQANYLQGVLDEVRLWSTARSEADLARDRYRALTGNEPGFVGYWRLDEPFGQGLADLSPNANTGSLGADGNAAPDDPVRVASTAWPRIRDLDGNPLDGTFTGTLPSGIGAPGADFVATFRIS
ncbi:MAG: LamG-like jellyroll fold domain-containing protein [Planctomycetota bacterium]|jgi:hypothetical protein